MEFTGQKLILVNFRTGFIRFKQSYWWSTFQFWFCYNSSVWMGLFRPHPCKSFLHFPIFASEKDEFQLRFAFVKMKKCLSEEMLRIIFEFLLTQWDLFIHPVGYLIFDPMVGHMCEYYQEDYSGRNGPTE